MHALVPTVLLRRSRIDVFEPDAELDPMHRQPRQPAGRAARGEGRPIVAAHRPRQTELAKRLVDDRLHRRDGLGDDAALDQKTAVGIGDGQRITALAIGGAEPALKVDAPQIVRLAYRKTLLRHRHCGAPASARCAQSLAPQQIADCRRRRPPSFRIAALQHGAQLLRPQYGRRRRSDTIAAAISSAIPRPCRCGARERGLAPRPLPADSARPAGTRCLG